MPSIRSSQQVLEEELLPLRAKLLEVAATLDRIDRSDAPTAAPETMATIRSAIETLLRPGTNRAEQVQLLFSRCYDATWRESFEI